MSVGKDWAVADTVLHPECIQTGETEQGMGKA